MSGLNRLSSSTFSGRPFCFGGCANAHGKPPSQIKKLNAIPGLRPRAMVCLRPSQSARARRPPLRGDLPLLPGPPPPTTAPVTPTPTTTTTTRPPPTAEVRTALFGAAVPPPLWPEGWGTPGGRPSPREAARVGVVAGHRAQALLRLGTGVRGCPMFQAPSWLFLCSMGLWQRRRLQIASFAAEGRF